MTDGRTSGQTDRRTDGGDCNIPDAFLKKRGDNKQMAHGGARLRGHHLVLNENSKSICRRKESCPSKSLIFVINDTVYQKLYEICMIHKYTSRTHFLQIWITKL